LQLRDLEAKAETRARRCTAVAIGAVAGAVGVASEARGYRCRPT